VNEHLSPAVLKAFEKTENLLVEGCTLSDLLPVSCPNIFFFSELLPASATADLAEPLPGEVLSTPAEPDLP
jgi:hypothetical protein